MEGMSSLLSSQLIYSLGNLSNSGWTSQFNGLCRRMIELEVGLAVQYGVLEDGRTRGGPRNSTCCWEGISNSRWSSQFNNLWESVSNLLFSIFGGWVETGRAVQKLCSVQDFYIFEDLREAYKFECWWRTDFYAKIRALYTSLSTIFVYCVGVGEGSLQISYWSKVSTVSYSLLFQFGGKFILIACPHSWAWASLPAAFIPELGLRRALA